MQDTLYNVLHPEHSSWRLTLSEKIDMIEELIDSGSYCGLSVNEVLDTKEARRAAALALAARELHARPEIGYARADTALVFNKKDAADVDPSDYDKTKMPWAVSNSASKMIPPSAETRREYRLTAKQRGKVKHVAPNSTVAFRGAEVRRSSTHVNPTDTRADFRRGGGIYTDNKDAQKERNIANAEKIIGTKGKEGYGYSTNRPVPHIHAKIAAHKDADDKAWKPGELEKYDRKWRQAVDAKAKRVHGKTQFAGNDGKGQQYHSLSRKATQISGQRGVQGEYRDNLSRAKNQNGQWMPGAKTEIDTHDERVKHYQAKAINPQHKMSDKLKYYRELDAYKTAKVRGRPVGKLPKKPDGRKGKDYTTSNAIRAGSRDESYVRQSGIDVLLRELRTVLCR